MKITKLGLILSVLVLLMFATVASGFAKPQNYDSGYQVQNLSETTDANITMTFYHRNGDVDLSVNDTIPAGGSNTYFPLTDDPDNNFGFPPGSGDVSDNFDGSMVISSNTEIAAIANLAADSNLFGASYNGFSSGGPEANLPLVMHDNYGFDTWVSVQNTGTSAVDITINYSDGSSNMEADVQPGAAAKFDQATEPHAPKWVGSAVVTTSAGGSGSIAATVIQEAPTTLYAYSGFLSGATEPIFPIYHANNYGNHTGIVIQNLGGVNTNVTVSYTASLGGTDCIEERTVEAGKSTSFGLYVHHPTFTDPDPGSLLQNTCTKGQLFVGAGFVTNNSAGVPLTAIVNQTNFDTDKGSAYNGFDPSAATTTILAPLVMDRNYGFNTGMAIINTSATDTIPVGGVDCLFVSSTGSHSDVMASNPEALGPGEAWLMIHGNAGTVQDVPLGNQFVGSGTCTASEPILAIVNELNSDTDNFPGDTLFTYEATNQ